jgi:hypothetical protein
VWLCVAGCLDEIRILSGTIRIIVDAIHRASMVFSVVWGLFVIFGNERRWSFVFYVTKTH